LRAGISIRHFHNDVMKSRLAKLIGSIDYMCEELERRRETYGISYIAVLDDGENNMVEAFAPVVRRLAGK